MTYVPLPHAPPQRVLNATLVSVPSHIPGDDVVRFIDTAELVGAGVTPEAGASFVTLGLARGEAAQVPVSGLWSGDGLLAATNARWVVDSQGHLKGLTGKQMTFDDPRVRAFTSTRWSGDQELYVSSPFLNPASVSQRTAHVALLDAQASAGAALVAAERGSIDVARRRVDDAVRRAEDAFEDDVGTAGVDAVYEALELLGSARAEPGGAIGSLTGARALLQDAAHGQRGVVELDRFHTQVD